MKTRKLIPIAILGATTLASHGIITFVSVATDLSNITPSAAVTGGGQNDTDNLWRQRDTFGEGGATVLEGWDQGGGAGAGLAENVPVLEQTVSGLIGGQAYDVYINYVRFGVSGGTPLGDRGSIRGSLDGTSFVNFETPGDISTPGVIGFSEPTAHASGDRIGVRGYLGTAIANLSGEISVFADDTDDNSFVERVWFDGASYEAVPEPSTALLGLLGALGLMRRQR